MRFAIQWSRQAPVKIFFVHVLHVPRLTKWSDRQYNAFATAELARCGKELARFVEDTYRRQDMAVGEYSHLVLEGISPDVVIADHCREHPEIDFICMGTRGAGTLKKVFGTNTGNLITHSKIPVIAVQENYRSNPVRRIMYATDLAHYEGELEKVVEFARPLGAEVDVLHFIQPGEMTLNTEVVERVCKDEFGYDMHFHFKTLDPTRSLVFNLQDEIARHRPSLVVMFTDRDRKLFQKLFFPSKSERMGMEVKVPLLVFGKGESPQKAKKMITIIHRAE